MPEPKWYTKQGADGKWYKTQASSPEEATAKFAKGISPAKEAPKNTPDREPENPFADRIGSRVMQNVEGMIDLPGKVIRDARERQNAKHPEPQSIVDRLANLPDAARSGMESVYYNAVEPAAKGIWGVSTPGLIGRVADKEDPANIAADAGLFLATGGEEPVKGALEGGAKIVSKGLKKAEGGVRIFGQEMAGAGKEPVYLENLRRKATEQERISRYHEDAQNIFAENSKRLQEHSTKVKEAQDAYQKELSEYQQATANKKSVHAEKVKTAQKEWVQKSYEAKKLKAAHDAAQNQLQAIQRGQESYAKIVKQNVEATHKAVKADLDSRWAKLNDQVGKQTPINSVAIRDAIEEAKSKFLMGSPESLKVFNDLTRQMTGEGSVDAAGGATPVTRPLTWEEGRVHYSALGDRMYSGELPGNVYKGLDYVKGALDRELSAAAKSKGAGKMYADLRTDWSHYMDDWRDMGAIATGGSPLARVLRAEDPGFVSQQISGKAGERMAATLGRYKKFGGNADAVAKYRALGDRAKAVPKIRVPSTPGKLELPAEPKIGDAPEAKNVKPVELKSGPRIKPVEDVDPVAVRRRKLAEMSGRPFRFYDLFPPYLIEHMAVKNPAIREWLATQPREELKP